MRLLAALVFVPVLAHAEVCRFSGTTSHDGRLSVRAETTESAGLVTVDVTVAFGIKTMFADVVYYGEEISTWRGGQVQSAAVNQRTILDGQARRQQWDVFERNGGRLEGYRVQAKRLADFAQRYPRFAQHWAPASFGRPWLQDYKAAAPERRPDLDLPAEASRTPLALAFYWSRFLPPAGGSAQVALPGFKRDKVTELRFGAAVPGDGWRRWSAPLVHPGLDRSPASLAAVWVSPAGYLLQIGFDVHTYWASGQAVIRAEGCQGVQIRPSID